MLPATSVHIAAGTADVQGVVGAYNLRLKGYTVAETAGTPAAASVVIRHGTLATDPILAGPINLAADGYDWAWFGDGIAAPNGIFIDRDGGDTTLVLYVVKT